MLMQLERWSRWAICAMLLLLPWAVYGVLNLPVGAAAALHKWLPEGKPERERYERFLEVFGDDHFLIVSWDACYVDDSRVEAFRKAIIEDSGQEPLIESVLTTKDVVDILTSDPLNLAPEIAAARLKGFLVGPHGTSALVVRFTAQGISNQKASIAQVFRAAEKVPDLGRKSLRMAGSIYESFAVDEASRTA